MRVEPPSPYSSPNMLWKRLWQTKLPPKILHFLWRACHEALPSRTALVRRGIPADAICPSCGNAGETTDHILIHCPVAVHTWAQSPLRLHQSTAGFNFLLGEFLEKRMQAGLFIFATVAWNLWKARNSYMFDGKAPDPGLIVQRSLQLVGEIEMPAVTRDGRRNDGGATISWEKPPLGFLKLNSDAGVFSDGAVGLGFVIRNSEGAALLVGAKRCVAEGGNSTIIEALVLRFGLEAEENDHGGRLQKSCDSFEGVLDADPSTTMIIGDILNAVG
ncbi:hypothetical protein ACS0TY_010602 [Phlomoides rotata]